MVAQAEEVADGVEERVGVVVVRLGGGRADGGAGVVEELVLEPHGHVGDGLAVGVAQVGAGGEEGVLSSRWRIGSAWSPSCWSKCPGVVLVAEHGVAGGRLALDDQPGPGRSPSAAAAVLLGLRAQVVDVVEHHLVEVADPRVEVAGDGDVEDQREPVAAGALDADVLLERDDRLVGGGGADHQVGLDQRLVQAVERHGLAAPAGGGGLGPLGAAVGDQDPAGVQRP